MRLTRALLRTVATLLLLGLLLVAGLAWAMHQPPQRFGKIVARVPGPLYRVLPFIFSLD